MARYFVDERSGCIAVRDGENTDWNHPGLCHDTTGVVRFWHGSPMDETCPTCGQRRPAGWTLAEEARRAAYTLCAELNAALGAAGITETKQNARRL